MVAAYGGLTVVLAVVIRGETLTPAPGRRRDDRDRRRDPHRRRLRRRLRGARFAGPGGRVRGRRPGPVRAHDDQDGHRPRAMTWLQVARRSPAGRRMRSSRRWSCSGSPCHRRAGRSGTGGDGGRSTGASSSRSSSPGCSTSSGSCRSRRSRDGRDVAGRPGLVVRAGGHDPRRRRVPRRAAPADPVGRAGRHPGRDDRDRDPVDDARHGEAEPEAGRALARLRADPPAARLDELLHDGQPDAGATARPVARLLDPVEALEDAVEVLGRDAVAGVGDRHQEVAGRRSARTVTTPPAGV